MLRTATQETLQEISIEENAVESCEVSTATRIAQIITPSA